ncbi:MAG TPA: hypothetical protein VF125_04680 [Solirubrobacterales bacterium]
MTSPGHSPSDPNPVAIAWYVEEAQRLLEDQQRRAESLRTRGGQVAGFGAVFLALIGANAAKILESVTGCTGTAIGVALLSASACLAVSVVVAVVGVIKPQPFASISADEITNYLTDRFLNEPDLWRVHVRSLRGLETATRDAQDGGNAAARAINISLYAFLAGLAFSVVAVGILILELI